MSEEERIVETLQLKYNTMLLNKEQTAQEVGAISQGSLDRIRNRGLIKSRKVGGVVRFHIFEIARFIADT